MCQLVDRFIKKNSFFPKHRDYPSAAGRREGNGNGVNINTPNVPDGRPINEEHWLSPCKIEFKCLNKALKYAQYHFINKLQNKNKISNI